MSKKKIPLEFLILAQIGDAILNRYVSNLLDEHGNNTPQIKHLMMAEMKSNNFIKDWKPLLRVRFVDISKLGELQKTRIKGDIVEASIAFLYINHGLESAERYIKTNLIKSLKKI